MCETEIEANGGEFISRQETESFWSGFWLRGVLTAVSCVLMTVMMAIVGSSWWIGGVGATFAVAGACLMTWFQHRSIYTDRVSAKQYLILGLLYLMLCVTLVGCYAFGLAAV